MTFRFLNRCRMSLTGTAGTGALVLNLPTAGAQSLTAAGMSDGDSTAYLIEDGAPLGTAWEIGVGTYHGSGTFTRDTITQSSAGGTTAISVTSNAILNATFRAQDFNPLLASMSDVLISSPTDKQLLQYDAGSGKWKNVSSSLDSPSTPTIVQSGFLLSTASGVRNIVLGGAPTAGNLLLTIGFGGGQNLGGGVYAPGLYGTNNNLDREQSWTLADQNTIGYAMHTVRSGESATQAVGLGDPGSTIPFGAVMVELAGVNTKQIGEFLMSRKSIPTGGASTPINVLSQSGALVLGFAGGDSGLAISGLTTVVNQTSGGIRTRLGSTISAAGFSGFAATNSSGVVNALLMSLVGV